MRNLFTILIIFIFTQYFLSAQKEDYNWIFGDSVGFTFNEIINGLPRVYTVEKDGIFFLNPDSNNLNYGKLSVSDKDGNLLFYSDGSCVYNKNRQIMLNGIIKDANDYEQSLAVPCVQSTVNKYRYLIFYCKGFKNESGGYNYTYCYSVIDMSLDNGLGGIAVKDKKLNFYLYWNYPNCFLTKIKNNRYMIYYQINSTTIGRKMIEKDSIIDLPPYTASRYFQGFSAVSPDGSIISTRAPKFFFRISLDNGDFLNGEYEYIAYTNSEYRVDSDAFSPDGTKFYFTGYGSPLRLYQYDLKSQTLYRFPGPVDAPNWQKLGPDGKIYCGYWRHNLISTIHNPNEQGAACNMQANAIFLGNKKMMNYDFPRFIPRDFFVEAYSNSPVCEGKDIVFDLYLSQNADSLTYLWTGPAGYRSNEQKPVIKNSTQANYGTYTLIVTQNNGKMLTASVDVKIDKLPISKIFPATDLTLCAGEVQKLTTYPTSSSETYLWSTGETSRDILVRKSGKYILQSTNEVGCTISDTININFFAPDSAKIIAPLRLCEGGTAELRAVPQGEGYSYLWSTGETSPNIYVSEEGTYSVTITFMGRCTAKASKLIQKSPIPNAEIATDKPVCEGLGIKLTPKDKRSGYKYYWSTGETSEEIIANDEGIYKLIVENQYGCRDSSSIVIAEKAEASIEIIGEKCFANPTILRVKNPIANNKYLWSTGETTEEITVSKAGKYQLIAENAIACRDTAEVELFAIPNVEVLGNNKICPNTNVKLSANHDFASYQWSTGEKSKEISINSAGEYFLTISDENGCQATASFIVNQAETKLQYDNNIAIATKTFNTELFNIKINNISDDEIIIDNIEINNPKFTIINNINKLGINEEKNIELSFASNEIGQFAAELTITVVSPCPKEYKIRIDASVATGMKAKVYLTEMEVVPGDSAHVPLFAQFSENMDKSIGYTATVLIKRDILWLDMPNQGDYNRITINGTAEISRNEQQIGETAGVVLLGKSPSRTILESVEWSEPGIETELQNGLLTLTGVCSPELRDIQLLSVPMIWTEKQVFGNEIEFRYANIEQGDYEISLFNPIGELVKREILKIRGNGNLQIESNKISSGIYYYQINQNGVSISSGKVMLWK